MADKDLELPSFGFGRRRRRKDAAPPEQPASADEAPTEVQPSVAAETQETAVQETTVQETAAQETAAQETSVQEPGAEEPATPEEPARPTPPVAEPEPAPRPLYADEVAAAPVAARTRTDVDTREPDQPESEREPRGPLLGAVPAALVAGLLVGAAIVGLTWAGLYGCEAVRGTNSCGNPGFLILVAIMVVMVVVGSYLLRALGGVEESGSVSFLGVGLVAVVALLFLVDVLFESWMVIAIPLISMVSFALARWVSTAFVEET